MEKYVSPDARTTFLSNKNIFPIFPSTIPNK